MTRSGDKKEQGLLYIHIDPERCFAAAGFYMPETDQLGRLRKAIKAKQRGFKTVLASLEKSRLSLGDFDQFTRIPKGFEDMKDGPFESAIRLKSFIVEEKLPDKLITTPKLAGAIEDFAGRAMPLLKFGWEALG